MDNKNEYASSSLEAPPNDDAPTLPLANQDGAEQETGSIDDNSGEKKPAAKLTVHQIATFISCLLASLANMMAYSILSVFYPLEAKNKGMSQAVIGLVFSSFAVASGVASPIWGKSIPRLGARFVFLAGAFVGGGCTVMYGFLIDMPSTQAFTAYSFVLRIMEGLGTSATITASAAIMAFTFPDNVGAAVGMLEMTGGLAFAIGPAIGGLLYDAGGFRLPFFSLGGFVLLVDILNFFILPQQGKKEDETGPMGKVLKIPAVWLALLANFLAAICMGSVDPTISIRLKNLGFSVIHISLLFLGFGLTYSIFSAIWGGIADKLKCTRIMLCLGSLGGAIFFMLLGPSPILNITPSKVMTGIVFPLGSAVLSLIAIPTFVDIMSSCQWYGIPVSIGLTSVVAGLWGTGFSLGGVVGPFVGGILVGKYKFPIETSILACILLLLLVILVLFGMWEYRCGRGRRVPKARLEMEANSTDDEKKPLISSNV